MGDKNEILENFQVATQETDIEHAITILNSCEWNLEIAINAFFDNFSHQNLKPESNDVNSQFQESLYQNHIVISENSSNIEGFNSTEFIPRSSELEFYNGPVSSDFYPQIGEGNFESDPPIRQLTFFIEFQTSMHSILVTDNMTILQIYSKLAENLDLNQSQPGRLVFTQGVLSGQPDDKLLREFDLPSENVTLVELQNNPTPDTQISVNYFQTINFTIKILNTDRHLTLKLKLHQIICDYIQDEVARHFQIPVQRHIWLIASNNLKASSQISASERIKLDDFLLSYLKAANFHDIEIGLIDALPSPGCSPSDVAPNNISKNSRSSEVSDEGEVYMDFEPEGLSCTNESSRKIKREIISLLACDVGVEICQQQFVEEFKLRYCPIQNEQVSCPEFIQQELHIVVECFLGPSLPDDRRALLIYLHRDDTLTSQLFPANVLCNVSVNEFLKSKNISIWPWDMTRIQNRNICNTWMIEALDKQINHSLSKVQETNYPVLLLLTRVGKLQEVSIMDGTCVSPDEVLNKLADAYLEYEEKLKFLQDERRMSEQRHILREEQDKAYQEIVILDEIIQRKIREEETTAAKQKIDKDRQIEASRLLVPDEPSINDEDVCCIRIRFPDSETAMRRFSAKNSVQQLIHYIQSRGYHASDYKILTTFPRRDLSVLPDKEVSLREVGLHAQETLILELL